jgi:hypothetical protein
VQTEFWKESLNSNGHQYHQYQQNEQPPLTLWWGNIYLLMESQPSDNGISNDNTDINKQ